MEDGGRGENQKYCIAQVQIWPFWPSWPSPDLLPIWTWTWAWLKAKKRHSNYRWTNPHPVGWCLPHSFQLCSVFWSSYCYSDQLHSVNWIFCVSKWSLMCFVLRQSNHKILFFRIYFCLKTRNETSLVTSMGLCLAEEENLNQRKKKSLMKALKMSIIHCVVFIISWTPYTFMATW